MAHPWESAVHEAPGGLLLDVEVVPNASSPGFPVGFNPWRKRIQARVASPAEEGRANEELCRLVAESLGVAHADVTVVDGATSRRKRIRIRAPDISTTRARLEEALGGG